MSAPVRSDAGWEHRVCDDAGVELGEGTVVGIFGATGKPVGVGTSVWIGDVLGHGINIDAGVGLGVGPVVGTTVTTGKRVGIGISF